MLFVGQQAVEEVEKIVSATRPAFASTNVHLIANLDTAVRRTSSDRRAIIASRADTEAKTNIAMLRLKELGFSCSLYLSDAEFLAGIATQEIDWSKPIQLVYSGGKYSSIDGIRCLTPIVSALRSINCTNSGVMGRALGWNKFISTRILQAAGIPTPKSWLFRSDRGWKGVAPEEGIDLIIKNNTEAWGLGVSRDPVLRKPTRVVAERVCGDVSRETGLKELIVQEFIDGPEIYTPVFQLGKDYFVFNPMEIRIEDPDWSSGAPIGLELNRLQKHAFRSHDDKVVANQIAEFAAKAMEELDIESTSRMDVRVDPAGVPKLFDMAEVPGLSDDHAIGLSLKSAGAGVDPWEVMMALNIRRVLDATSSSGASVPTD